jgi:hypothetical protein
MGGPGRQLPKTNLRTMLWAAPFLFLAPLFLDAPGFRFPLSTLRSQVSVFSLSEFQLFASCLLLAGYDFDQALGKMESNGGSGLVHLWEGKPMADRFCSPLLNG